METALADAVADALLEDVLPSASASKASKAPLAADGAAGALAAAGQWLEGAGRALAQQLPEPVKVRTRQLRRSLDASRSRARTARSASADRVTAAP